MHAFTLSESAMNYESASSKKHVNAPPCVITLAFSGPGLNATERSEPARLSGSTAMHCYVPCAANLGCLSIRQLHLAFLNLSKVIVMEVDSFGKSPL